MGKKEMVHSKVIVCKSWVQDSPLGLKNKVSKLLFVFLIFKKNKLSSNIYEQQQQKKKQRRQIGKAEAWGTQGYLV